MSENLDEETKSIIAQAEADAQSGSDDSKDKSKTIGKTWMEKDDDGKDWETNDKETPDEEW